MALKFENEEYEIRLRSSEGVFQMWVPDLNLYSEGTSLDAAFSEIVGKKSELIAFYEKAGISQHLPDALASSQMPGEIRKLIPFFVKSATVALVGVMLIVAASVSLTYTLREPARKAGLKFGRSIVNTFVAGLNEFSEKELTRDREAKIRLVLRNSAPKLKPYIEELRPLFDGLQSPPGPQ